MALPALVLVHGGQHAADCWDLTVDEIHRQAPELTVLAVDLPGRRGKPGDLLGARIADWVDSVVADIEDRRDLTHVVIVGHSMAGLTVPGVATKLGSSRVREMILARRSSRPRAAAWWTRFPGRWLGTRATPRSGTKKGGARDIASLRGRHSPSATG